MCVFKAIVINYVWASFGLKKGLIFDAPYLVFLPRLALLLDLYVLHYTSLVVNDLTH